MSKIDLSDVNSGYNRSAINSNFQRIKDFLNDRVLMRNNVSGEPNTVLTDIDFNGKRLYNLPAPSTSSEPARLQDLSDVVASGAVLATSTNDGLLSKTGFTKLAGIDDNATRNSTDIALLSRANHTGSQAISTVTGLQTALDSKVGTSGDVAITGNVTGATFGATSSISSTATSGAFKYGILSYSDTNIFASYKTTVNSYSQIVAQNSSNGATASVDFVVSNDLGTATTYYGNIGMNSSGFTGTGSFNKPNAVYISSTTSDLVLGTTTANPIRFVINGGATDAAIIDTSGNLLLTASGTAGYGSGSGGTVTQLTDKGTGVTLNKPSGSITMNAAALAANTTIYFTLSNTKLAAGDGLLLSADNSVNAASYNFWCSTGANLAYIFVRNITGGSLSEALVLNFQVIKGARA